MRPKVNKYLVVLAGPTAVGKAAIAIELAKRFNSVIVSADSRQLFREMTIGTAKPSPVERAAVPHYFIDHASLEEPYSAGKYAEECHALLDQLFKEYDIIFLVGGAGFYVRAVIEGFDKMPAVPLHSREKWEHVHKAQGLTALQEALRSADPEFANYIDMHNHRRLIRALSLIEVSGKSVTELRKQARDVLPFIVIKIFCNLPRDVLYAKIHDRVDRMIENGLVEEVKSLLPFRNTQAMQTVGYREIIDYFDGRYSLDEAIAKVKQHSCNYAKRQLTWFRHQGDWKEFNPPDVDKIEEYILGSIKVDRLMG